MYFFLSGACQNCCIQVNLKSLFKIETRIHALTIAGHPLASNLCLLCNGLIYCYLQEALDIITISFDGGIIYENNLSSTNVSKVI